MPSLVCMCVTDMYIEIFFNRGLLRAGSLIRVESKHKSIKMFRLNIASDSFYLNPD